MFDFPERKFTFQEYSLYIVLFRTWFMALEVSLFALPPITREQCRIFVDAYHTAASQEDNNTMQSQALAQSSPVAVYSSNKLDIVNNYPCRRIDDKNMMKISFLENYYFPIKNILMYASESNRFIFVLLFK